MEKRKEILKNEKSEITRMSQVMENYCEKNDVPMKPMFEINLVLEEILMNIISYGFEDDKEHEIEIDWWIDDNFLNLIITDDGKKFDPLILPEPDLDKSVDERKIGGLGIHLVKKMMCEINYRRENGKNILKMKKKVK
ncbi:MAG: ATP-binding protein [Candidatus Cloacimonetes bacterium]|nr:ATP-binding protein [Candidatus Cloacimonadota bacterium]MCF7813797.1 ATP-binding protein [Candidatus Cloacimonadota bacterium]MCF7868476.1 ATP-binding protein [Candidatus Cloacimonadota bacterium]